jgi:hypothetical protein
MKEEDDEIDIEEFIDEMVKTGKEIIDNLKPIFDEIQNVIKALITDINAVTLGKELKYEEAMNFFISHKHDNNNIAKGAMLKSIAENGYTNFIQVFLDKNNKIVCTETGIPLGRKLKIIALDEELKKTFKKTNLVIVE